MNKRNLRPFPFFTNLTMKLSNNLPSQIGCQFVFNVDSNSIMLNQIIVFCINLIFSFQKIPRSNGFLSAVVTQLPELRRALATYPVLSWSQFCEHMRAAVNPLASDDDVKLLDRQLQLMGEVSHHCRASISYSSCFQIVEIALKFHYINLIFSLNIILVDVTA